jgi:hypothetical protein
MMACWAFDTAARAAGAIPAKYKELMALAVAFTTQCPYCIEIHAAVPAMPAPPIRKSLKPCWSPQPCALEPRSPTAPTP